MKNKNKPDKDGGATILTKVELELMKHIWDLGEGSVKDVLTLLPEGRKLAYTSVSTILRILEQKGIVKSRKEGRAHIYTPTIAKETYEADSLMVLLHKVFDGEPTALVRRLLDCEKLTGSDIEKIKKMLKEEVT